MEDSKIILTNGYEIGFTTPNLSSSIIWANTVELGDTFKHKIVNDK